MSGRQVGFDEARKRITRRSAIPDAVITLSRLLEDVLQCLHEQRIPRFEMRIESAMREAGRAHELRHTQSFRSLLSQSPAREFDKLGVSFGFARLAEPHRVLCLS